VMLSPFFLQKKT